MRGRLARQSISAGDFSWHVAPTLSIAAPVTGGKSCHSRWRRRGLQVALRNPDYGGCHRGLGRERGDGTERGAMVTRGRLVWVRRLSFAAVLVVAAFTPGGPVPGGFA